MTANIGMYTNNFETTSIAGEIATLYLEDYLKIKIMFHWRAQKKQRERKSDKTMIKYYIELYAIESLTKVKTLNYLIFSWL